MKRIFTILLMGLLSLQLHAQKSNNEKQEKLEALRIAFFTKQLELSPEEAQKFWPVYNNYQSDLQAVVRKQRSGELSSNNYNKEMVQLRNKYRQEFVDAVGPAKFNRLLNAERNWGEMLRNELQRRGGPNQGKGMGPEKRVGPPAERKGPPPRSQGNRGQGRGN